MDEKGTATILPTAMTSPKENKNGLMLKITVKIINRKSHVTVGKETLQRTFRRKRYSKLDRVSNKTPAKSI